MVTQLDRSATGAEAASYGPTYTSSGPHSHRVQWYRTGGTKSLTPSSAPCPTVHLDPQAAAQPVHAERFPSCYAIALNFASRACAALSPQHSQHAKHSLHTATRSQQPPARAATRPLCNPPRQHTHHPTYITHPATPQLALHSDLHALNTVLALKLLQHGPFAGPNFIRVYTTGCPTWPPAGDATTF